MCVCVRSTQQDFVVAGSDYPEWGLKMYGLTLLPFVGQAIVPIYNLPSLTAENYTLVGSSPLCSTFNNG